MRELYLLAAERTAPPRRLYATGAATGDVRADALPDCLVRLRGAPKGLRPALSPDDLLHALVFAD